MRKLVFKGSEHPEVMLEKPRITIGRDKGNNVVIDKEGVSGFHAELQSQDGEIYLVDLGSTNGTSLNGQKVVGKQKLKTWDIVAFDEVKAEIVDPDARRPTVVRQAIPDNATKVRAAVGDEEWFLEGIAGAVTGTKYTLKGKMVAGREDGCDIKLPSDEVSRKHAEFEVDASGVKVRDLGSANGTKVNGQKVSGVTALKPGDEVTLDVLTFKIGRNGGSSAATVMRPAADINATKPRTAVGGGGGTEVVQTVMPKLVAISGDVNGMVYPVTKDTMTIGRLPENDIVVDDTTVSSRHAKLITIRGEKWKIEDFGSTNGILVNDVKVPGAQLKTGDTIHLGKVTLRFDDGLSASIGGTQVVPSAGDRQTKTSVNAAAKGGMPGWVYGAAGFLVVAAGLGVFMMMNKTPETPTAPVAPVVQQATETPKGDEATPATGEVVPQQMVNARLQGGKLWSRTLENGRQFPSTPALGDINGDHYLDIIVGDGNGFLLALDGQEGKKIIDVDIAGKILAPIAVADLNGDRKDDIIVTSDTGTIMALNGNGQILWKASGDLNIDGIINAPAVVDITGDGIPDVIVPTTNKGLVGLDGNRGWKLWDTADMTNGKVVGSPVAADLNGDGVIDFVSVTDQGQVIAVSATGEKVWQIWGNNIPEVLYASPLFIGNGGEGIIVVATKDQGVYAIDAKTGRNAWSTTSGLKKTIFASPVGADVTGDGVLDVIVSAHNGDVHAIDGRNGDEYWKVSLGTGIAASPALFDANGDKIMDVFLLDSNGNLVVLDGARGRALLTMDTGAGEFMASPILGDINNDGLVDIVTASKSGEVTAYGINRTTGKGARTWSIFLGNGSHAQR